MAEHDTKVGKQRGLFMTIPKTEQGPAEHLCQALGLSFPERARACPADQEKAIEFASEPVHKQQLHRKKALRYWRARARALEPERQALLEKLGDAERGVVGDSHLPVLREMFLATGLGGTEYLQRLSKDGTAIIGTLREEGVYPVKGSEAPKMSLEELYRRKEDVIQHIERVTARDAAEDRQLVWDSLKSEAGRGVVSGPFHLDKDKDQLPESFVVLRRFIVEQPKPDGTVKKRPCDDGRRGLCNEATSIHTPICLPGIDDLVSDLERLTRRILDKEGDAADVRLASWIADHSDAYKRLLAAQDVPVYIAAVSPCDGSLYLWRATTLVFGESGAVLGYGSYSSMTTCLVRRILGCPTRAYVDDYLGVHRYLDDSMLDDVLEFLRDILGQAFNYEKTQRGVVVIWLGVRISLEAFAVTLDIGDFQRKRLRDSIATALAADELAPEPAGKMAGRLSWCSSVAFGRNGRAYLPPIYARQHSQRQTVGRWPLGKRLREALQWWAGTMSSAFSRTKSLMPASRRPLVLYTDASGLYGVGAVLLDQDTQRFKWFSFHYAELMPVVRALFPDFTEEIEYWETFTFLLAAIMWRDDLRGRQTFVFIDNECSQASTTKGWSESEKCNGLIALIWRHLLAIDAEAWVERVASDDNCADPPSRGISPRKAMGAAFSAWGSDRVGFDGADFHRVWESIKQ
ncbi:unnamed protein product [Amoebophrya sp. A120]|nr:unnamed protein product [Amoebophrya sp. A120]|eukprot:GSA120T00021284001.1